MSNSAKDLTLEFMHTEKGQYFSYKLNAILGLKYNEQNKYSHNFLVQFQNTKTKYVETVEIPPELLRYKFKLGNTYKEGKIVSKEKYENEDYLEINTLTMKEQKPLYEVLSENTIKQILGNNSFNQFKYGANTCYVHEENDSRYIIPSYVVALYYYFRSSSMKEALFKGNPFALCDYKESNLDDKTNAILILESHASKLDGPFIYRFLTDEIANKGFIDFLRYISSYKLKNSSNTIPIKSLFPTKEIFNIKIRYKEIKDTHSNKKTYLVNEIKNDDSTLNFEQLTILKKKKKDIITEIDDELKARGRKPRRRNPEVTTRTPSSVYGTSKIKEIENTQNLSLSGKNITYGSLEIDNPNPPLPSHKEGEKKVGTSFSKGQNSGDTDSQQLTLENDEEQKNKNKIPVFDIFLKSIEFIEDSNLVSEFNFNNTPENVPASYTESNRLTALCSVDGKLKQYISCEFEYNDIFVILLEVESDKNDFATWVFTSNFEIDPSKVQYILEMRFSGKEKLDTIKTEYNNLKSLKFFTYRHAQINDENDHDEVLQRWLLRLFSKIIN